MKIDNPPLVLTQKEQPLSSDVMKLQIFLDAKPEKRAEHFQETVEYFIGSYTEDVQAQNIGAMIDRVNMNIRNGEIKPELFIDKKRFNGKTFFQRILETKNEKLIEVCRERGVDYDPQEDFKVFIKGIDKNPEYTTLDNYNIIDKIIRGFNDSDKYRKFEGFNISDYLSKDEIISYITVCSPNEPAIVNRIKRDAEFYAGGVSSSIEVNNIADYTQKASEQKRVEAENRSKGLGLWDTIKSWFKDIKDRVISPELSPELKKVQEALKEGSRITIEEFHKLLDKLTAEDANILKGMWHKYYERKDRRPEFAKAMYYRLLEFSEPKIDWRERSETKSTTTPTQTSSVEPSNNTLSTATSAQNPEDTEPKVLEGEIMKPEHINVSNKRGKEYEPTTINGEYRIIDDGIAKKVGDKDIKKAPYRNQELISGGKNPDKYKITTKGATQDIIRSLPEHNNKRFITSQQEVLIPEIVKVGGVEVPGGHIIPDNIETIEGGVQRLGSPQTGGENVGGQDKDTTGQQQAAAAPNPVNTTTQEGQQGVPDKGVEQAKDKKWWEKLGKKSKEVLGKATDRAKGLGLNVGKIIKSIPSFTKAIPKVVGGVAKAVGEDLKDKWKKLKGLNIKDEFGKLKEKAINIKAAWDSGELQKNIKKSWDKEKKRARRLGLKKYMVKMLDRYNKRDISTKYAMSGAGVLLTGGTLGLSKFASVPLLGIAKYREGYKKAYKEKMLELVKKDGVIENPLEPEYIFSITPGFKITREELLSFPSKLRDIYPDRWNNIELTREEYSSLPVDFRKYVTINEKYRRDLDGLKIKELEEKRKDRIKEAKEYANKKARTKGIIWGSIAGAAGLAGDYFRGDGPVKYLGDKVFPDRDNYFDNNPNNFINDTQIPDTSANSGIPNTTPPEGTNITGNPDTGYQTPTPADATTPVNPNPNPNPISQTPNPTSTPGTISTPDTASINSFGDNYTIKAGDRLENVFEDRMSEVFGPAGRDNPERLKEIYNMFKNPEISDMLRDAGVRYDNTGIPNIIKPGQEIPFAQILSKAKELGLLQE